MPSNRPFPAGADRLGRQGQQAKSFTPCSECEQRHHCALGDAMHAHEGSKTFHHTSVHCILRRALWRKFAPCMQQENGQARTELLHLYCPELIQDITEELHAGHGIMQWPENGICVRHLLSCAIFTFLLQIAPHANQPQARGHCRLGATARESCNLTSNGPMLWRDEPPAKRWEAISLA